MRWLNLQLLKLKIRFHLFRVRRALAQRGVVGREADEVIARFLGHELRHAGISVRVS